MIKRGLLYQTVPSLHCLFPEPCGTNEGSAPEWRDYLVISPLWSFKRSWLYCGHATSVRHVKHISLCHKMALSFRSNNNHNCNKGFHCTYTVIPSPISEETQLIKEKVLFKNVAPSYNFDYSKDRAPVQFPTKSQLIIF